MEVCFCLSTDSSLLAIQENLARQDVPFFTPLCHSGTNFVGAAPELDRYANSLEVDTNIKAFLS